MNQLKKLRGKQSQEKIASHLGITQRTYSNYENQDTQIPDDIKIKMADYFGVSVDFLLGREEISTAIDYSKIPPDVQFAFANGMDGLTQDDVDDLVRLANLRRELNKSRKK